MLSLPENRSSGSVSSAAAWFLRIFDKITKSEEEFFNKSIFS